MVIKTKVLDRAAFFLCYGADLIEVEGRVPDNVFTLEVEKELVEYERKEGYVNYRKFCNMRKALKKQNRLASGLPAHYMAPRPNHQLKDIARIVPWRPGEI